MTNIRYADDLILYATSLENLVFMLETLFEELAKVGLNVNGLKSKIMTSTPSVNKRMIDVNGDFIEIMCVGDKHKYLGRMLSADPNNRSLTEYSYRSQCA